MPATSQLEWLSSTTAMIVLFWSRATRDLLRSFGWGIAALHRLHAATKLPSLAARPIASISTRKRSYRFETDFCRLHNSSRPRYGFTLSFATGTDRSTKRLRASEAENAELKRPLADAMLDNTALRDLLGKMV